MTEVKREKSSISLSRLADCVLSNGDDPSVITFTRDGVEEWSCERLGKTARQLAGGLVRDGLQPGEKVILFAPASAGFFTAALAVLRAGGVVTPVDVQISDDHLKHVIEDSAATRIFTTQRLARRLGHMQALGAQKVVVLDADAEDDAAGWTRLFMDEPGTPVEVQSEDTALLFYTSGTTGLPKGVPLSHGNVQTQIQAIKSSGLVSEGERMLLPLPLHHVYPVVIGVFTPLALGVPIVLPYALTGGAITGALRESRATIVLGVPRLYRAIFEGIRDKVAAAGVVPSVLFKTMLALSRALDQVGVHIGRKLFRSVHEKAGPNVRILASGGSPLEPELARNLEALGWPVAVGYGLTETSPLLTLRWPYEGRHASVGRAMEGVELKIDPDALKADDDAEKEHASQEDGTERGELLARGGNVFSGYHNLSEATEKAFSDDWFRTGDVAHRDADGFVYLHGRVSTMIVREGGENVDPEKVEAVYETCPDIEEVGVLEDEGALAALVLPRRELIRKYEDDAALCAKIQQSMETYGAQLTSYQRVSRVQISRSPLERTRLGKLKRRTLEELYAAAKAGKKEDRPSEPVAEDQMSSEARVLMDDERVRQLWMLLVQRYPKKPVSPDAHLEFDLGLDSLERVELALAIEERLQLPMDENSAPRLDYVRDVMTYVADYEGDETAVPRKPLTDPEAMLSASAQKQVQPRGALGLVVATALYGVLYAWMRVQFRVESRGLEHVPKEGSFILMPNHVSYLDAPAVAVALRHARVRRCYWAGWSGLMFRNTLWRTISRLAQVIPIDADQGPVASLAAGALVLKREEPLVWFPEGGISVDGKLKPFRQGVGLLLEAFERPVVPVYIEGTRDAMPPGRRFPRRAKIRIHFGKPYVLRVADGDKEGIEPHKRITADLERVLKEMCAGHGREAE